jgi:phosphopantetheine--protein transferase-like protein
VIRRFDLDEDRLFQQHTLGRQVSASDLELLALPVVPLTVTMELLAETGALLKPGQVLIGMRDVRASRWITLENVGTTLELSACASVAVADQVDVSARERRSDGSTGPVLAEATLRFAAAYPAPPESSPFTLRNERPSGWKTEQLYQEGMFHGPCFQAVRAVDRYGDDGTVARLEVLPRDGLLRSNAVPRFLTDPVVLDAAGQVLAYWVKERCGILVDVFPYALEELRIYAPPARPGTTFECRVRAELVGDTQTRCDIGIVDGAGSTVYEMKGWRDRRFALPEPFVRLRISPADADISVKWDTPLAGVPAGAEVVCRRLECLTEDLLEAHGGIWLKVLAYLVLSRREREIWESMTAVPKRRQEWLLGRVVAKDVVRQLIRQRFGLRLAPADVEILPDERGRPQVQGQSTRRLGIVPVVSISHSHGVAGALAALDRRHLIGIDIESVSQRKAGFETAAFTPAERRLVASLRDEQQKEWYLRLWCAKEAVGKALGCGLAGGITVLEVQTAEFEDGAVKLRLGPSLAAEFPEFRDREIVTYTAREGDFVSSAVVHLR